MTRYEKSGHSFQVGDIVRAHEGDRRFARVVGFESFEGSGLVFVDGLLQLESLDVLRERFVLARGAVQAVTPGKDHDGI